MKKNIKAIVVAIALASIVFFNGFSGGITSIKSLVSQPEKYNKTIVSVSGTIGKTHIEIPSLVINVIIKKFIPDLDVDNLIIFTLKDEDGNKVTVAGLSISADKVVSGKSVIVTGKFVNIPMLNYSIILSKSVVPSNKLLNSAFPYTYPIVIGIITLLIVLFIFFKKKSKYVGRQLKTSPDTDDDIIFDDEEDIDDDDE